MGSAAWNLRAEPGDLTGRQRVPLKIGHRASNMRMIGNFDVFRTARQIPGIMGVELQAATGTPNLHDLDAVRRYKAEANRWGLLIPSLAGVWDDGASIRSPQARSNLQQAIRAGELLAARVILVPAYNENSPDMSKPSSYEPMLALLSEMAPRAADAGIILGIETSMSPQDHGKFVDMAGNPALKVYYDVHNMAEYGHVDDAISGIRLLGKDRICQVHVKNQNRLIGESGLIDWAAAFQAFNEIGYEGWYVFETQHRRGREQMIDETERNVGFLQTHCRMPEV